VQGIITMRHVFKILQAVIGFGFALMITFLSWRARTYEGQKDQLMDTESLFLTIFTKRQFKIAVSGIPEGLADSTRSCGSRQGFHPSQVADLIESFVSGDGFPDFGLEGKCKLEYSGWGHAASGEDSVTEPPARYERAAAQLF
jgi:hypothetical protein